jgi:hypothetical protein
MRYALLSAASHRQQYTEKLNQMTEGSLDALTRDRLLVLDWTRALTKVSSGDHRGRF